MSNEKPSIADLAWFAGFFDGEGSISIRKRASYNRRPTEGGHILNISVSNTHLAPIERCKWIWELGTIHLREYNEAKWQRCWYWTAYSNQALYILETVYPFLIAKAGQAKLAIEFQSRFLSQGKRRDKVEGAFEEDARFRERLKALNRGDYIGSIK